MIRSVAFCLALLAAACGGKSETSASEEGAKSHQYKVQVTFTPRTLTKLRDLGEKVEIANWYYGLAKPGTPETVRTENDQIALGENIMTVDPVDQVVTISVAPFAADKLSHVEDQPMLLINVYTARKSSEDNLINCGIFDDALAKAEPETIDISCDLIEPEPPPPPAPTEPPPPQPDVP